LYQIGHFQNIIFHYKWNLVHSDKESVIVKKFNAQDFEKNEVPEITHWIRYWQMLEFFCGKALQYLKQTCSIFRL
jgi:hypothetical protein